MLSDVKADPRNKIACTFLLVDLTVGCSFPSGSCFCSEKHSVKPSSVQFAGDLSKREGKDGAKIHWERFTTLLLVTTFWVAVSCEDLDLLLVASSLV